MPARIVNVAVTQWANAQSDGDVNKFPLISRITTPSDMFSVQLSNYLIFPKDFQLDFEALTKFDELQFTV